MTLQETYFFFEGLKTTSTNKHEIKIYEKFIHILSKLKVREFSENEIESIETELDHLNLKSNPEYRKKHFKKALTKFEKFLKDTFSLTSEGYYTNLYGGLGTLFGVVAGVVFGERFEKSLGLALGISIGLVIGSFVGRYMDSQAKTAGNLL